MSLVPKTNYTLPRPGLALGLLFCLFVLGLVMTSVLMALLTRVCQRPEAAMRISAVIQDLLVFVMPAIGMALLVCRVPARLLAVDRWPRAQVVVLTLLTLVASLPAMNCIVEWNQNIHFPQALSAWEVQLRAMEEAASSAVEQLMGGTSAATLVMGVLIVGVMAGFSEELLFRGALQRVMMMTRTNGHVVVWMVALVFSACHMQVFGFVPRMLLGAFFGYLLWWSGSLWLPIAAHAFNNTLVVLVQWFHAREAATGVVHGPRPALDTIGSNLESPMELTMVLFSLLLTIAGVWLVYLRLRDLRERDRNPSHPRGGSGTGA